jgi:hypothetical protein
VADIQLGGNRFAVLAGTGRPGAFHDDVEHKQHSSGLLMIAAGGYLLLA